MPERDYLDYQDWLNAGGLEGTGQQLEDQDPFANPRPPTTPATAPVVPPTTTTGGGKTPAQIEAEGREYDRQHGLIGGYMNGGVWVNGSPSSSGPGPRGYEPGGDGLNFSGTNPNDGFQWPTYNAPRLSYGEFPGFKPFQQPSMDDILADPVLQAQLTEGRRGIKQDRAFRGILNTGDTLKDIFDWSSNRVKLGANDAFDRAFKVYDINERQNPFNTWSANKDLAFGLFDRNAPQAKDEFMLNQYEPARKLWEQNYNQWAKTGDWLTEASRPPA